MSHRPHHACAVRNPRPRFPTRPSANTLRRPPGSTCFELEDPENRRPRGLAVSPGADGVSVVELSKFSFTYIIQQMATYAKCNHINILYAISSRCCRVLLPVPSLYVLWLALRCVTTDCGDIGFNVSPLYYNYNDYDSICQVFLKKIFCSDYRTAIESRVSGEGCRVSGGKKPINTIIIAVGRLHAPAWSRLLNTR